MAKTPLTFFFCLVYIAFLLKNVVAFQRTKRQTTSNMCPEFTSTFVDDSGRTLMLDIHNRRRTLAARGEMKNGRNSYNCPQAANMMEMTYECDLEADAQAVADTCQTTATPADQRIDGELLYVANEEKEAIGNSAAVFSRAADSWWGEINKNGINQKMLYNKYFSTKPLAPTSFTQMAWARSSKIGCGIGECGSKTIVVCRYREKGNIIGQNVWQVGTPCSGCSYGCSSTNAYLCANSP